MSVERGQLEEQSTENIVEPSGFPFARESD